MTRFYALDGIRLEIAAGEYVTLTGPSGCGKTALLNVLALLEAPETGSQTFMGQETAGRGGAALRQLRRNRIGYIFQELPLVPELSVAGNVELGLEPGTWTPDERRRRIGALLDRFGLAGRAHWQPSQLPKGQQQCVAVARAVVASPPLVLADEPTAYLDRSQADEVLRLLRTLHRDGSTIVLATQLPECAAQGERTIRLEHGRVAVDARRQELG